MEKSTKFIVYLLFIVAFSFYSTCGYATSSIIYDEPYFEEETIFYEEYYLAQNPDVALAINQGYLSSGWEHYLKWGKDEGRDYTKPDDYGVFNETYYLSINTDVAYAVQQGILATGWQHYQLYGRDESRSCQQPSYDGIVHGGLYPGIDKSNLMFYTNAQYVVNCGLFDVDVFIDGIMIGSISTPYIFDYEPVCTQGSSDEFLVFDMEPGTYNYSAVGTCGGNMEWNGTITVESGTCYKIFLDAF